MSNPLDGLLESARRAHEAGHELAFLEALYWCSRYEADAPVWAARAALKGLAETWGTKKRKRTSARLTQYRRDMKDLERHYTVERLCTEGYEGSKAKSLEVAFTAAAIILGEDESTISKAYYRVRKREKEDPYRYKYLSVLRGINDQIYPPQYGTPERYDQWAHVKNILSKQ